MTPEEIERLKKENDELKAHLANKVKIIDYCIGRLGADITAMNHIIRKDKSPAQSLTAIENRVIERIADTMANDIFGGHGIAERIRQLKDE